MDKQRKTSNLINIIDYDVNDNVLLGEHGILLGFVDFDNTPTTAPTNAGSMYWNDADGTANLILKGGEVTLQIGQETLIRVVNKTATNINLLQSNYQAVRITGAQGQRPKVDLAQATNDLLSAETIGLVTETINNNQEGFINTSGLIRGINTTGSLQGETWEDGDVLYLSPTVAGNVTKVKPMAPNHLVIIGYVIHAHITQGTIFVKVDNGYELDELHNVKIDTPLNNQGLVYNSTTQIWENKTTFQLPTLTSGSVLFSNGSTLAQDNSNFFWDDANNRLGIGTNAPVAPLHIRAASGTGVRESLIKMSVSDAGNDAFIIGNGTTADNTFWPAFVGYGSSQSRAGLQFLGLIPSSADVLTQSYGIINFEALRTDNATDPLNGNLTSVTTRNLFSWTGGGSVHHMIMAANGNIIMGGTTNAGFKLDVSGSTRLNGNTSIGGSTAGARLDVRAQGALSTDIAFRVRNSADTANLLTVQGNGNVGIGTNTPTTTLQLIYSNNNYDQGFRIRNSNTGIQAITGLILEENSTGNPVGAFSYYPSNYIDATLRNTAVFATVTTQKIGFQACAAGGAFAAQDIFFSTKGGNANYQMQIKGNTGNVQIGTNTDIESAILNVSSTTKGFLPPRMTTVQRDAIATPATGLQVFNTTLGTQDFYNGTSWDRFGTQTLIKAGGALSTDIALKVRNNLDTSDLFSTNGLGQIRSLYTSDPGIGATIASFLSYAPAPLGLIFRGYSTGVFSIQNQREINNTQLYDLSFQPLGAGVLIGTTISVPSSALTVESTTRGFLPPRMTNAQRLAIASPAIGLIVYCTDATEGLYVNKSTGWIFVI